MCQVIHIVIQVCFLTGLFVQKLRLVEGKYGGEIDRRALSKGRGKEFANQGTAVVHFEASVVLYFGSERLYGVLQCSCTSRKLLWRDALEGVALCGHPR